MIYYTICVLLLCCKSHTHAFKSFSVMIWFIVIRQTNLDSNAVYYFSDPTTMSCFSLSLSLPTQILPISKFLSQRTVNKTSWSNHRQTRICYIFQLWVIIKALLKTISLYLLSHFSIRIIVLTCPDNKSARNQPKSCVPAKSHKSQWCQANMNIISIEIFAAFQFVCVHVKTREYHH